LTETFDVFYEATPWLTARLKVVWQLISFDITADFRVTDELFDQIDDWQLAAIYS